MKYELALHWQLVGKAWTWEANAETDTSHVTIYFCISITINIHTYCIAVYKAVFASNPGVNLVQWISRMLKTSYAINFCACALES